MTFHDDYTFGATRVDCDIETCNTELEIEGFDGHPLPWSETSQEIKKRGWRITKSNGQWVHLCPDHA